VIQGFDLRITLRQSQGDIEFFCESRYNHLKYTKTAIEKSGNEYQKFKQIQKKKEKEESLNELENDIENLGKKL